MKTFKQFLTESGNATAKYETARANQSDIKKALETVSSILNIPYDSLKQDLLGSTELTLLGKKQDSGDIDIGISLKDFNPEDVHAKMMGKLNNEGVYSKGTNIGSYAVPVNGKKVQVDLMFLNNKEWGKFFYHSALGRGSKYPGAVRNIILLTALAHTQTPGEDFVIRDDDGNPIIRASKSANLNTGMRRIFKMAKVNAKTGKYNKTLDTVSPEDIQNHLDKIGKQIKFSHKEDFTDKPEDVIKFIFGDGVTLKDTLTAEDVISHIKKLKNANEILNAAKKELTRNKLPIPEEL